MLPSLSCVTIVLVYIELSLWQEFVMTGVHMCKTASSFVITNIIIYYFQTCLFNMQVYIPQAMLFWETVEMSIVGG